MVHAYSGMMADPIRLMEISRWRVTFTKFLNMSFPSQPQRECLETARILMRSQEAMPEGAHSLPSGRTQCVIFFSAHTVLVFMVEWDLWPFYLRDHVNVAGTKMQWRKRKADNSLYSLKVVTETISRENLSFFYEDTGMWLLVMKKGPG